MPTLNWLGKKAVINHDRDVPFHLLQEVPELSFGDKDSGNLLIQGDNLMMGSTERKQLEASPTYTGLCAKRDALLEIYHNSLRIAGARIQSLRKR